MKLIRNAVKCKICGGIVESKSNYDYKSCSCGALSVDGGLVAPRIIGERDDYEVLYEWATLDQESHED